MHLIHKQLQNDLREVKLSPFKDFAICPHSPDENCECRKPHPKMILDLISKYKIDPEKSYMIGDKLIDAQCGVNAGVKGIVIRQEQSDKTHPYFKTLLEFAQALENKLV